MRKAIAVRTENPESIVPQPSDNLIDARDTKGAHGRDDDRED
jgi:hypothetical protein